ncbi:MAG: hypothetical protein IJ677_07945 [Alphaproteobacteria bacterium]|nr:hypothetical protein [Alphaproteobacteria bacterium]
MNKLNEPTKQELKDAKAQVRERFSAYRRGARDEEIQDHNGKPFTHKLVTQDKTKYNRKTIKRISRDDY